MKNRLTQVLIGCIILFAAVLLLPEYSGVVFWLRKAFLFALLLFIIALFVRLNQIKNIEYEVRITEIRSTDRMNPSQYISKGGAPCAGSDGRVQVTFQLIDGTQRMLSLSARQSVGLASGMRGTLVYRDAVFISFKPE